MSTNNLKISSSRIGSPTIPSPHPKQIISLEEWEARAPLSDFELRSITHFQDALNEKPWPLKESLRDTISPSAEASPATHSGGEVEDSPARSGTHVEGVKQLPQKLQNIRPVRPVQTTQEFYDWFAMIERSVAHSQEAHYREHLAIVENHLETCKDMSDNVHSIRLDVNGMLDGWRSVEAGGRSLKGACEQLLDERDELIELAEDIGARLEYFQELERATRMLNHPGESLVLQSDFLETVERVDICIDFLRAHRNYREADIYLLRFQQCLTRAMTLIKMYFIGSLKALTSDILKRVTDRELSSTAQMHLLYTRFQSVAIQVAPLLGELERRTRSHPDELSSLLAECHSAYFSARKPLLTSKLAEEIKGLDPSRADLVELTRAGCSYLKQVCVDEFSIYRCFFNSGQDILYAYLEGLCDYLYDDLRPRILHEPRLSVLCNVCKVLQALMVLDVPEESSSDEEDVYPSVEKSRQENGQGFGKLRISHMLRSILQDAQTRLFFKAQSVVQAEIRYYVPKGEELDYPKRLQDAPNLSRRIDNQDQVEDGLFSQISSYEEREMWYTPLRTTIAVLTQLHEFVQPLIFDDIAQEAIGFCRANLFTAANTIIARTSPEELDAQLFLIRHLLVLKEMSGVLNLTNRDAGDSFEFRHVTETLKEILRSTNFMSNAFALSKTRDEAPTMRFKEGVDGDLKRSCEFVIQLGARLATKPIQDFMLSLDGPSVAEASQSKDTSSSARSAKPRLPTRGVALDVESAFRAMLEQEVPQTAKKLELYLANRKNYTDSPGAAKNGTTAAGGSGTVQVLLGHVQERIVDAYVAFRRAAEFLPIEEIRSADADAPSRTPGERTFASPEDIRTLFKSLC